MLTDTDRSLYWIASSMLAIFTREELKELDTMLSLSIQTAREGLEREMLEVHSAAVADELGQLRASALDTLLRWLGIGVLRRPPGLRPGVALTVEQARAYLLRPVPGPVARCIDCGYDLAGLPLLSDGHRRCPECGRLYPPALGG